MFARLIDAHRLNPIEDLLAERCGGCGIVAGGICPALSRSLIRRQRAKSSTTASIVEYGRMSNCAAGALVP
jgi:hypothetical protein